MKCIDNILLIIGLVVVIPMAGQVNQVVPAPQEEAESVTVFESLEREEIQKMTLRTDTRKLVKDKMNEEYQPAELTYTDNDGKSVLRQIEVKTRGNLRLVKCGYPPLRFKFAKEEIGRDGLSPPNKLKLVSSCEPGEQYQQLVLREFLVYKLYNVLSDDGFKVQLIALRIEDTEGKDKPRETFAFVIENEDEMAMRMGGEIYDPQAVTTTALHRESYDLFAMFQYIVGNTDWFVLNKHNVKFVLNREEKTLKAVPYDFDYAGLVNAPYAVTNVKLPIDKVTERYFIGMCREEEHYTATVEYILSKKPEMVAVVEDCKELNISSREWIIDFLKRSFDILEDSKLIGKEIKKGCDWSPLPTK